MTKQLRDRRLIVTRACDKCKHRKVRCNGEQPCERCKKSDLQCRYDTPYNRGKPPPRSATAEAAGALHVSSGASTGLYGHTTGTGDQYRRSDLVVDSLNSLSSSIKPGASNSSRISDSRYPSGDHPSPGNLLNGSVAVSAGSVSFNTFSAGSQNHSVENREYSHSSEHPNNPRFDSNVNPQAESRLDPHCSSPAYSQSVNPYRTNSDHPSKPITPPPQISAASVNSPKSNKYRTTSTSFTTALSNHLPIHLPLSNSSEAFHSSTSISGPASSSLDEEVGEIDGPSSIAFLDRAMKRLRRHNPVDRFTFGNSRIPDFDAASFILPSLNEAHQLAAYYFDNIASTNRLLHRPTTVAQINSLYSNRKLIMSGSGIDRGICATIFMLFAHSSWQLDPLSDSGVPYYLAAERQLEACHPKASLPCVQAWTLMALFLAMSSRMDQSWALVGKAIRLAQTLGLHRKGHKGGLIEHEMRKRTFWVLYTVDRMVSVIVGRPCGLHDQDIDQEYPALIDDEDLKDDNENEAIERQNEHGITDDVRALDTPLYPCFILATVEHVKLTRIVSLILFDFYSAQRNINEINAKLHASRLTQWKKELASYLDDEIAEADPRVPILRNARITILTAYYHAQILVYRPFLMDSGINFGIQWVKTATNECLRISGLVFNFTTNLVRRGLLTGWFTIYNSINAVLVVYVHTIKSMGPGSQLPELFLKAESCEQTIRENTQDNILAERFLLVLKELRMEIRQQVTMFDQATGLDLLVEAPSIAARVNEDWYEFENSLMETLTSQIFDFQA